MFYAFGVVDFGYLVGLLGCIVDCVGVDAMWRMHLLLVWVGAVVVVF